MTLQEKKELYDKYITKPVIFTAAFADGSIRYVEDILESTKIVESINMVLARIKNIDYSVNVDILYTMENEKRFLIAEKENTIDKV